MRRRLYLIGALASAAALIVILGGFGATRQATPGVTDKIVKIGGTFPLSGPASSYAPIASSMASYFAYINQRKGPDGKRGVYGRQIQFIIKDDGYNPANTIQLTKQLVEQDQVFAMVGGLGTEPQLSVRDYLNQSKVPQIYVSTGATTFSRDYDKYPWTIGWQPDYEAEGKAYGDYILKNAPNAKIGILYQADDYGADYVRGLEEGLGAKKSLIISRQGTEVTAPSVASQVAALKKDNPDTWMIFATPGPTIRAYITATKLGFKPSTIITNSVSATDLYLTIAKKGGSDLTDGTITDAYAKDPASPLWKKDPGMRTYYRLMGRFAPKANLIDGNNLYGFAKAYTFVDTLYKAGKNPTRESLMAAAQSLNEKNPFLLPGVVVKTSKTDHFAVSQITLTKYTNNTFVNFGGLFKGRH